jgi:tight adherence protein C
MVLLFALGVLLLGLGAGLILRSALMPRLRVAGQMREIVNYGFAGEAPPAAEASPPPGPLSGLAARTGSRVMAAFPSIKPLERREIVAAGMYDMTPETLHGYRVLAGIGLPGLLLTLAVMGGSVSFLLVLLVVFTGLIAWFLPMSMVRTRGQRRLDKIDRDLPELIDVLTATVEAGLGFGSSLQIVADRFSGPLGAELRLTLQEQTMGLSTEAALSNMLERCETPSVRGFVRAVLQGDTLGVSIGATLRNVASDARKRRRALARERAQRAPIKLLFPLVFLIFPAMLLVLMFPTAYDIVHVLGGGH